MLLVSKDELRKHSGLNGQFKCNFCAEVNHYAPNAAHHEQSCRPSSLEWNRNQEGKRKSRKIELLGSCPRCPWSSIRFTSSEYIAHHLEAHLNLQMPLRMHCPLCGKRFFQTDSDKGGASCKVILVSHMLSNHHTSGLNRSDIKVCLLCPTPVKFRSYSSLLTRHRITMHHEVIGCPEPECAGLRIDSIKRHGKIRHADSIKYFPWECETSGCTKRFRNEEGAKRHLKSAHNKKRKMVDTEITKSEGESESFRENDCGEEKTSTQAST